MDKTSKKRVSILKKQNSAEESSPTESITYKSKRKIRFSGKKSIKEFCAGEHADTIWGTSYEESAGSPASKSADQHRKNNTSFGKHVYQHFESTQKKLIVQEVFGSIDKENSMYNDIKYVRSFTDIKPLQDIIREDGNVSLIFKKDETKKKTVNVSMKDFDKRLNFTLNRSEQNILGASPNINDGSSITLEPTEIDIVKHLRKKSPRKNFAESVGDNSYLNNTDIDMSVDKMNTTEGFLKIEMIIERSAKKSIGGLSMENGKPKAYNLQKLQNIDVLGNNCQSMEKDLQKINTTDYRGTDVSINDSTCLSNIKKSQYYNDRKIENEVFGDDINATRNLSAKTIGANMNVTEINARTTCSNTSSKISKNSKITQQDIIPIIPEIKLEQQKTGVLNGDYEVDCNISEIDANAKKDKERQTLLLNDEMELNILQTYPRKVYENRISNKEPDIVMNTPETETMVLEEFDFKLKGSTYRKTMLLNEEMEFDVEVPMISNSLKEERTQMHIKSDININTASTAHEMEIEKTMLNDLHYVHRNKNSETVVKQKKNLDNDVETDCFNFVFDTKLKGNKNRQTLFLNDEMDFDISLPDSQKVDYNQLHIKSNNKNNVENNIPETEVEALNSQRSIHFTRTDPKMIEQGKPNSNNVVGIDSDTFEFNTKSKGSKCRQTMRLDEEMDLDVFITNPQKLEKSQVYVKTNKGNHAETVSNTHEMKMEETVLSDDIVGGRSGNLNNIVDINSKLKASKNRQTMLLNEEMDLNVNQPEVRKTLMHIKSNNNQNTVNNKSEMGTIIFTDQAYIHSNKTDEVYEQKKTNSNNDLENNFSTFKCGTKSKGDKCRHTMLLNEEMEIDVLTFEPQKVQRTEVRFQSNTKNNTDTVSIPHEKEIEKTVLSSQNYIHLNRSDSEVVRRTTHVNNVKTDLELNSKSKESKSRQTLLLNDEMEIDISPVNSQKVDNIIQNNTKFDTKLKDYKYRQTMFLNEEMELISNPQKAERTQVKIINGQNSEHYEKQPNNYEKHKIILLNNGNSLNLNPQITQENSNEDTDTLKIRTNSNVVKYNQTLLLNNEIESYFLQPNLQSVEQVHNINSNNTQDVVATTPQMKMQKTFLNDDDVYPVEKVFKASEKRTPHENSTSNNQKFLNLSAKNVSEKVNNTKENLYENIECPTFEFAMKSRENKNSTTLLLKDEMNQDILQSSPQQLAEIQSHLLSNDEQNNAPIIYEMRDERPFSRNKHYIHTDKKECKRSEQRETILFDNERLLNSTEEHFSHNEKDITGNFNEDVDCPVFEFEANSKKSGNRQTLILNEEMELSIIEPNQQKVAETKVAVKLNFDDCDNEVVTGRTKNLNSLTKTDAANYTFIAGKNICDKYDEVIDAHQELADFSFQRYTNDNKKSFMSEENKSFPTDSCGSNNFKDIDDTEVIANQLDNPSKYFSEKMLANVIFNKEDDKNLKNIHKNTPPEAPLGKRSYNAHSNKKCEVNRNDSHFENNKNAIYTNKNRPNETQSKWKDERHFQKALSSKKFNDLNLTGIKALDCSNESTTVNFGQEPLTKNEINTSLSNETSKCNNNESNVVLFPKSEGNVIKIENIGGDTRISVFSPEVEQANISFLSNLPTPVTENLFIVPVIQISSPNPLNSAHNKSVGRSPGKKISFSSGKHVGKSPRKEIIFRSSPMKCETPRNENIHINKNHCRVLNFNEEQKDIVKQNEVISMKTSDQTGNLLSKTKMNATDSAMKSVLNENYVQKNFKESGSFYEAIENTNLSLADISLENCANNLENEEHIKTLQGVSQIKNDIFPLSYVDMKNCSRCRKCRYSMDTTNFDNFKLECASIKPIDYSILDKFKNLPTIADVWIADERRQIEKYSLNFNNIKYEKSHLKCMSEVQFKNCFPFKNKLEAQLKNKFPIINDVWKLKVLSLYNCNFIMLTHYKCLVFELIIECCPLNFEDFDAKFYKIYPRASCIYPEDCWSPKDKLMYLELSKNFPSNESLYNRYSTLNHLNDCLKYFNTLVIETTEVVQELMEVIIFNDADLKHYEDKVAIHKIHRYYSKDKIIKQKMILIKIYRINELSVKNITSPSVSDFTEYAIKHLPIGIDFVKLLLADPIMYLINNPIEQL